MPSATAPTRKGYNFGGYYTATSGGGTQYYNASMGSARKWDKTAATTLYAKWTGKTYTVTFNKQSGSGGTTSVTATYGSAMPSATAPTRSGYNFSGYYITTGGSGTQYYNASMGSVRKWDLLAATTLYAYWKPVWSLSKGATTGSFNTTSYSFTYNGITRYAYLTFSWTRTTSGSSTTFSPKAVYHIDNGGWCAIGYCRLGTTSGGNDWWQRSSVLNDSTAKEGLSFTINKVTHSNKTSSYTLTLYGQASIYEFQSYNKTGSKSWTIGGTA